MPNCPRCGNKFDNDFLKEKGLCSECGFAIRQGSLNKVSIDKYNASVRKNVDTTEKKMTQSRLKKVNADSLKKKSAIMKPADAQQIAKSKQVVAPVPNKEKQNATQTDVQSTQASAKTTHIQPMDPIFDSEQKESVAVSEKPNEAAKAFVDNVDLSDPIFVNATGPLSFDNGEEDAVEETLKKTAEKNISPYEGKNITIIDEDIPSNANKFFLPFYYLKKFYTKRKNLRTEHLEASIDYDFNHDGFYNDTVPVAPYEIDAINKKNVMKVIAAIIGVFAFISFIIYYA